MNRNTELAMLAGVSYQASRSRANRFPIPEGWAALSIINWPYGSTRFPEDNIPNRAYWQDGASGFEAAAFTQGNEIIVSFAGTDFDNEKAADGRTNAALGQGQMTRQLEQAAEFLRRIQTDPANAGKTITLTGHSLGGGLAALLGVMMDVQAVTFDPAPFRAAATESNAAKLNQYLASKGLGTDAKLASYTTSGGYVPVPLGALLRLLGPIGLAAGQLADITSVVFVPINIARESNVKALAVQGEFLTGEDPTGIRNSVRIHSGELELLTNRASDASSISLHSQALLTLLHASLKGDASSGFFDAATRYKSFLGLFFNTTLFKDQKTNLRERTPVEHILRHQFGVPANCPNGGGQVFH